MAVTALTFGPSPGGAGGGLASGGWRVGGRGAAFVGLYAADAVFSVLARTDADGRTGIWRGSDQIASGRASARYARLADPSPGAVLVELKEAGFTPRHAPKAAECGWRGLAGLAAWALGSGNLARAAGAAFRDPAGYLRALPGVFSVV